MLQGPRVFDVPYFYAIIVAINIGSGNGLLLSGNKPFPEPM